jgi:Tol biopolymer transport system component
VWGARPARAPQNLVEINGPSDEADPAVSVDGRELFFATSRAGGSQLWHALRTCLSP